MSSGRGGGPRASPVAVVADDAAPRAGRGLVLLGHEALELVEEDPCGLKPRMKPGSPVMCTSDNISVGMLTCSSAAAMSVEEVVKGWPANGCAPRGSFQVIDERRRPAPDYDTQGFVIGIQRYARRRTGSRVSHAIVDAVSRAVAICSRCAADVPVADCPAGNHGHSAHREPSSPASVPGARLHQHPRPGDGPARGAFRKPALDRRPLVDAVSGAVHAVPGARRTLAGSTALARQSG